MFYKNNDINFEKILNKFVCSLSSLSSLSLVSSVSSFPVNIIKPADCSAGFNSNCGFKVTILTCHGF